MVKVQDLNKTYQGRTGSVRALKDVSLEVEPGEFVAVQGPSGCGKTTLLLSVGALLMPTGGRVIVDGKEPYTLSAEARSRFRAATLGFVFQQFYLVPYLSVLDNILAPALATGAGDAQSRARELAAHFGLDDRLQHVPAELSVGERQRVALARAVFNRPKVLLADEATGNLDRQNAAVVLDHLKAFADNGGAVLLVTHDPQAAERAVRTLHLVDGRLEQSA